MVRYGPFDFSHGEPEFSGTNSDFGLNDKAGWKELRIIPHPMVLGKKHVIVDRSGNFSAAFPEDGPSSAQNRVSGVECG